MLFFRLFPSHSYLGVKNLVILSHHKNMKSMCLYRSQFAMFKCQRSKHPYDDVDGPPLLLCFGLFWIRMFVTFTQHLLHHSATDHQGTG